MGLVFFCSAQMTQTGLGATQTLKESLGAVHVVCWQLNRASKSKKVDYRKNWNAVDSPISTVNSILLSGTGVAASGMPGKIVSTA